MTLRELPEFIASLPDDAEVVISLFKSNGTVQALPIDGLDEAYGLAHLETSEEEGLEDGYNVRDSKEPEVVRFTRNLMSQFTLVSFTITVLIAVVLALVLSHKIRADAIATLVHETVGNTRGHLLRAITPADLEAPMRGIRYDKFHAFIQASIISERTARVKLWAKDGTLIYSNDPRLVGQQFPIKKNLRQALHGKNAAAITVPTDPENTHDTHLGTLMEVYTPIIFPPSKAPQGAFEIYQYYEPTAQRIRIAHQFLFGSISVGFIVLYGSLGSIVWGGWRTIKRQRETLTETNMALLQARDELERRVQKRTVVLAEANQTLHRYIAQRERDEQALRESENHLRVLSSSLLRAQERERKRLSRELHDELGQALMILKLRLGAMRRKLPEVQNEIKEEYDGALQYVDQIIEDVRRLALDLSPSILEDLGLTAALRWMIKDFAKHWRIEVILDVPDLDKMFPAEAQIIIYRLFQETFVNVGKHAQATQVSVVVKEEGTGMSVVIEDDGKGFDVKQYWTLNATKKGLGLAAMEERAKMLGGCLTISSQNGHGTRIHLAVPKYQENHAE